MDWIGITRSMFLKAKKDPAKETISAYFRKVFSLEECPGRFEIHISALSKFKLWINGECILAGPCRGDWQTAYYDTVDIAPYLREGKNLIAVQVVSYCSRPAQSKYAGPGYCHPCDAGPMLAVEGGNGSLACLDAGQWEVQIDKATDWDFSYPVLVGAMECVDGGKLIKGWNQYTGAQEGFHEAESKGAASCNPYGEIAYPMLKPRPIPLLAREGKVFQNAGEVVIRPHCEARIVLDAGKIITAYPRIAVRGGKGGRIRMTYAESYVRFDESGKEYKTMRDDSTGILHGYSDEYAPSGGMDVYEPFLYRAFRFLEITAQASDEAMTVEPLGYIQTAYPLTVRSVVRSDEKWINDLWEISKNTLQSCMHDSYEDCPYYEQLQYAMDTRLEILFTYMLSGDTALAGKAIGDFHDSRMGSGLLQSRYPSTCPQVIPGFSLYWILMLEDYFIQTADLEFLKKYIPTAEGIVEAYRANIGGNGMVQPMGYWDFADWTKEWDPCRGQPAALEYGASALQNLLYVYALKSLARVLRAMGRKDTACEYEEIAGHIMTAVERLCYDENREMYREGESFEQFSQHTQVWAVLTGLAKGDKAHRIMTHALHGTDVVKCSFVMQFYLFRALEKAGMYRRTMPLWDQWKHLIDLHCTTIPETPHNPRSDCHAWGALPLYEFTAKFLGVEPAEPGWKSIAVRPRIDLFPQMEGEVATPWGIVMVKWDKEGEAVNLNITVPRPVKAYLLLPDGKTIDFTGSMEMII